MAESRPPRLAVAAAFAAVYVIWGSTYLAIKFCLETLPPFLTAGLRFLLAGTLLLAWCRLRGPVAPTRGNWWTALVTGGLMLLGGNGGVVWAQQHVPSGLAALIVACVPLWMVGLDWARPGGTRPSRITLLGIVVGLVGVALLVLPGRAGGPMKPAAAVVLLLGSGCWALGSLLGSRMDLAASPLLATALQMLCGGALLAVAGLSCGEAAVIDPAGISLRSTLAFFYLVVFGSLIAYSCYCWLLRVTTPARASTYAYVNPVVAVFLGYAIAGETFGPRVLLAGAIIIAAVVVITTSRRN